MKLFTNNKIVTYWRFEEETNLLQQSETKNEISRVGISCSNLFFEKTEYDVCK